MKKLNRREFLRLSAMTAAGAVVVACQPQTVVVKETVEVEKQIEKVVKETVEVEKQIEKVVKETVVVQKEVIKEVEKVSARQAPMLQEMVKAEELPPLEERLPLEPLVVVPLEEIGQYGGTWRMGMVGPSRAACIRNVGYEGLMRFSVDAKESIPNVVKGVDISSGGTIFTFRLRNGMKWSDGEPFTADDILFWYEDMALNKDITPHFKREYMAGGEPCKVEKVDETTVRFVFVEPHGLFVKLLAHVQHTGVPLQPKHYLKQFHPSYVAKDELDKKVKEAGFENWWELFGDRNSEWANTDRPALYAWRTVTPLGTTSQVVFERNPYYWKVDPEGNQLPYLDRVFFSVAADRESLLMDAVAGEIDFQHTSIDDTADFPLLSANAEKAGYRFFYLTPDKPCFGALVPHLTHKDPVKREILQNKDFRIALSYAINHQELADVVFRGRTYPRQVAPWPASGFEHERLATQYLEYEPDKANAILDEIFPEKDDEGFRLGPDGKRIFLTVEMYGDLHLEIVDMMEMVKKYWADVGIEIALKPETASLCNQRWRAGECDVYASINTASGLFPVLQSNLWWPQSNWFPGLEWWRWYSSEGEAGEEPPEPVMRQIELYKDLVITMDPEKQKELYMGILDIAADQFYTIGLTSYPKFFGIVKNDFRNVPLESFGAWGYPDPAPTNPCTYFWKKE